MSSNATGQDRIFGRYDHSLLLAVVVPVTVFMLVMVIRNVDLMNTALWLTIGEEIPSIVGRK